MWQSVNVICDCPGKIESWEAFIERGWLDEDIPLEKAKADLRDAIGDHLERSEYCSEETVTMCVHRVEEVC